MVRNWLITGGCGFIGVNLIRVLKKRGDYIRVLDNLSVGSRDDLSAVTEFTEVKSPGSPVAGTVELMVGDIRDADTAKAAVDGVDAIVHLAAQTGVMPSLEDPKFDCDQNVVGIFNMLKAAKDAGVKKFVFASSSAPLGDQDPPVHEQKVPKPLSPYGASKLAGEGYCSAFFGSFGIDTVALRFSNAYGPYSFKKGSVVALFFRRALAGEPLIIYGDGGQTRDFIHTDDLCQAIIKGAESGAGGEVFQVATGTETTVNEMTSKIKRLIERDTDRKVEIIFKPARKGEITRSVSDISKARRVLGYEPAVGLDEGLEETWGWFRERLKNG
ncbi:MAG: GDP-mannose 4,6-dehydratase [Nitrospirae bacterium]|nr:GDP-mannose 4,6-dehydratase [Nitrospirota bacterium]MBI5696175.1 GDP-mannose 4,6-dehydratase [Nitrospirota bacterium]